MVCDPEKIKQIVRFRDAGVALLNTPLLEKGYFFFPSLNQELALKRVERGTRRVFLSGFNNLLDRAYHQISFFLHDPMVALGR